MRRAAREEFLSKYTAERNYELLMDIYRAVLPAKTVEQVAVPRTQPALSHDCH
jgi:hypothetical protein